MILIWNVCEFEKEWLNKLDGTSNGAMLCGRYDIRPERLEIYYYKSNETSRPGWLFKYIITIEMKQTRPERLKKYFKGGGSSLGGCQSKLSFR